MASSAAAVAAFHFRISSPRLSHSVRRRGRRATVQRLSGEDSRGQDPMVLDANPDCTSFPWGMRMPPCGVTGDNDDVQRQRQRENNHIHAPPTSYPLLESVSRGKGLHGTTLLALRHPEGTRSLLDCMETVPRRERCHLDRFLFDQAISA